MNDENYYGVIYKITNLVNGKVYVGQTVNPIKRWNEHKYNASSKNYKGNMAITKAMSKYNIENFTFEIIDRAKTPEELNLLEEKYIEKLDCLTPKGYNILSYNDGYIKPINKKNKNATSKYNGVAYDNRRKNWTSFVNFRKEFVHIGCFENEEDAAKARDIEIIKDKYSGLFELNFPELRYQYLTGKIIINKNQKPETKSRTSKFIGVSFHRKSKKWRSRLYHCNKAYLLGYFNDEIDAAIAYNQKAKEIFGKEAKLNIID
jgi:group I intron endonuclease